MASKSGTCSLRLTKREVDLLRSAIDSGAYEYQQNADNGIDEDASMEAVDDLYRLADKLIKQCGK